MSFVKPGPNKRVCAFFIDSIIAQTCGVIISLSIGRDITWFVWVAIILLKDYAGGKSLGKTLVGIQVIDRNGLPANIVKTISRNILMVLPVFPIIEYFVMLRDAGEGKRIGDSYAKTMVTDLKPEVSDSVFLWISLALFLVTLIMQVVLGPMLVGQNSALMAG